MVLVLEHIPETHTTELTLIALVTEDVLLKTKILTHAISMVDQTIMTRALKLMSDAQVNHTRDHTSTELDPNLLSAETLALDMFGERPEMANGDHLPLTTSGITTMVLKLSVET
jgi:hypothetical protein